jgi:hypothetical protein
MPNNSITVGTSANQEVAAYNPRRQSLLIQNRGTASIFVSENAASPTSDGIEVTAGGAIIYKDSEGDPTKTAHYAQSLTGNQTVVVYEGVPE